MERDGYHWGTGRRKTSVARVRIRPGSGQIVVNKRPIDEYFPVERYRRSISAPLMLAGVNENTDVFVNVNGGGLTGQAGAIRMGLSRALMSMHPDKEQTLRNAGMLTRDARMKERKKYGQKGARASFQFSKR